MDGRFLGFVLLLAFVQAVFGNKKFLIKQFQNFVLGKDINFVFDKLQLI